MPRPAHGDVSTVHDNFDADCKKLRRDSIVGLERLLRYCARPPFAAKQLEIEAVSCGSRGANLGA
jgi:hypothetical protein